MGQGLVEMAYQRLLWCAGVGLESAEDAQQVSALKEQVRQSLEDGSRLR